VDGTNQSEIGGSFLWTRKAEAHCEAIDTEGAIQKFSGWHNGYKRLQNPVIHQRDIVFDTTRNCFEVTDLLSCTGRHEVEICWHLAEDCIVALGNGEIVAQAGPVKLVMLMEGRELLPTLLHGNDEMPAGWISRAYDVKTPTNSVVWKGSIHGDTRLCTQLIISFDEPSSSSKLSEASASTRGEQ
jgi:Heparinase II/III-like protein